MSIKRRGVMIVVAIIGILAAIAIPNFMRFQLKAKASEGKTNLAAIRTAEESYMAEFGTYVGNAAAEPAAVPGSMKSLWPGVEPGFLTLGWAPEGSVYYQYEVGISAAGTEFWAGANADIDGNGTPNQWAYVKPVAGAAATTAAKPGILGAGCVAAGVYDPATTNQDLLNTVGPCDGLSGASEF
jgi:type IV pilus assembly protein PilA